jgi:ABC-2 type transport system permease protein
MRRVAVIAGRELRSTFGTAFGYGLVAGFLAFAGLLLVLALRAGEARLDDWFAWLFVTVGVLAPLLAMRTLADEERAGSLELLLTSPVRTVEVVGGKLLGVVSLFLLLVVGTLVCPWLVATMGNPDTGPIATGYIGLVLVGVAFLSVGLAASAATANQLVAAAGAAGLLLALWFGAGIADGLGDGAVPTVLRYLSPSTHVTGFLRGTLAAGDIGYFVSLAVVGVCAAVVIVEARR